jgi:hypothetical protein
VKVTPKAAAFTISEDFQAVGKGGKALAKPQPPAATFSASKENHQHPPSKPKLAPTKAKAAPPLQPSSKGKRDGQH